MSFASTSIFAYIEADNVRRGDFAQRSGRALESPRLADVAIHRVSADPHDCQDIGVARVIDTAEPSEHQVLGRVHCGKCDSAYLAHQRLTVRSFPNLLLDRRESDTTH